MSSRSRRLWVAGIAALPYLLLPGKPLLHDARIAILNNPVVQHGSLLDCFRRDFWGNALDAAFASGSYRPLVSLTWALQARVLGNGAALYHAGDILLHVLVSVLVLMLLERLSVAEAWRIPAALVFALHPLVTEAVASGVGRADLMAAAAILGAVLLHEKARGWRVEAAALTLLGAAMLCKESAVMGPFVVLAVDLARRPRRLRLGFWGASLGVLAAYLLLRVALIGELGGVGVGPSDSPFYGTGLTARLATAPWLLLFAARLVLVPYPLNHHYCTGSLAIADGPLDPRALAGMAFLGVAFLGAAWVWQRRRDPLPAIALALFVLPLLPALNTVSLVGVLFAERWMVLPLAGLSLFVGWALHRLAPGRGARLAVYLVLALLAAGSALRVQDWSSSERLARTSLAGYPGGAKVWNELGLALADQGRHAEALEAFERSVHLAENDPRAWMGYATTLYALGRFPESVDAWQRLLALSPKEIGVLYKGLGQAQLAAGRAAEAASSLEKAAELLPDDLEVRASLEQLRGGSLREKHAEALRFEQEGHYGAAAIQYGRILNEAPNHVATLFNLGRLWLLAGEPARAIPPLERGLELTEDPRARALLDEARRRAGASAPDSR